MLLGTFGRYGPVLPGVARNTVTVIAQSSSVILVSMAGSLSPDPHRFEQKVIREYPYEIPEAIRPHSLGSVGTIRRWWHEIGRGRYPGTRYLTITADGGGSNSVLRRPR